MALCATCNHELLSEQRRINEINVSMVGILIHLLLLSVQQRAPFFIITGTVNDSKTHVLRNAIRMDPLIARVGNLLNRDHYTWHSSLVSVSFIEGHSQ